MYACIQVFGKRCCEAAIVSSVPAARQRIGPETGAETHGSWMAVGLCNTAKKQKVSTRGLGRLG
jgi:hypothetical protein